MATTDARNNKSLLRAFETLGNTQAVGDFLDSVPDLSVADRWLIVDQAMVLIDQLTTNRRSFDEDSAMTNTKGKHNDATNGKHWCRGRSPPQGVRPARDLFGFPEGASSGISTAITRPIALNGKFVGWTAR